MNNIINLYSCKDIQIESISIGVVSTNTKIHIRLNDIVIVKSNINLLMNGNIYVHPSFNFLTSNDFSGDDNVEVLVKNDSLMPTKIKKGTLIATLILMKIPGN